MNLKEINKTKTPELFYSSKTDEVWNETDTLAITGGIQLRKRCLNGWQDLLLRSGALQLYFVPETIQTTVIDAETSIEETVPDESNAVLVADGILIPQKKVDGTWENMQFTSVTSAFTEGDTDAQSVFSNGIDTATIDFKWRIGDSKQTYTLESTVGSNVRMAAIVNDYKEPGTEVKQSFADYLGLTAVETLTEQDDLLSTKYVFESEGKVLTVDEPVFVVDPYLELAEENTYIDVTCDGYLLNFNFGGTVRGYPYIYDPTKTTELVRASCAINGYYLGNDDTATVSILEDTPTRVVLQVEGYFDDDYAGGNDNLQNTTPADAERAKYTFTIYPDRFVTSVSWTIATTVVISYDNSSGITGLLENACTNESNIYETSGSEDSDTGDDKDSAKYIGWTSDEINIQGICLEHSESGPSFHQRLNADGDAIFQWESGTMAVGTHTMSVMWIIDSAEREAGDKLYGTDAAGQTGRLQQGIQYTNLDLLDITTGAAVTGGIDDDTGFHADGAYHIGVEYE